MKTKEQLINLGIEGFKADELVKLQDEMLKRAVKFQFKKKDGTIRDAIGTRKRELMILENGQPWEPVGPERPESETNIKYFDLEKKMWREFICTNFIGIATA